MSTRHYAHWPRGLPHDITIPATSVYVNLAVSAVRYPDKPALVFYDTAISYREFLRDVDLLAGYLQQVCGVRRGDRVLLYSQNCPQWAIGYYAILRADAVVVPVNAMSKAMEAEHYAQDSGAVAAIVSQELLPYLQPVLGRHALRHAVVATYADYLRVPTDLPVPEFVRAAPAALAGHGLHAWRDMLAAGETPGEHEAGPDDWSVFPYTSGTTGHPKGCIHTHRSVMHTLVTGCIWSGVHPEMIALATLPFFHVTGMQSSLNSPIYMGATLVILPRWERTMAAQLIERYQVSTWTAISTMVVDLLANPDLGKYDIGSLMRITGGGAAMPEAVAKSLFDRFGLTYLEGYGLSETIAPSHINPPQRAKRQCLGIPICNTEALVVEVGGTRELGTGETGEILIHGPQVFQGYWNQPAATAAAFVEIEGKRFLRSGDLGYVDEDGYYFIVDRVKRMINASGFKVWPAEVENMMYAHPDIQEACVIGVPDPYRGESVKAFVVLKAGSRGSVQAADIIGWCKASMAAYKVPQKIEFRDSLPKSGAGKLMWRQLQEEERSRAQ
ncbi:MAG: long-chain fatty acid--CoA ligase [Betaproteobacteria bacterium]|nr:long-chain fatty acid--CoA ligase [Betaproteobacteria bacterium]